MPDNGAKLKKIYRSLILAIRRINVKARIFVSKQSIPDVEKIYWISPNRIIYYTNYCGDKNTFRFREEAHERIKSQSFRGQVFHREKDKGKIYGGNWDVSNYKFSELEVYQAIEQRIKYGIEWKKTSFFMNAMEQIQSGNFLWDCKNEHEFLKRCKYLDKVIGNIRENGYQLNSEAFIDGEDKDQVSKRPGFSEEVMVNIGRNGEYLFQDGRHRLAIAKVLNIKSIPVKVLVRHKEWQELREVLNSLTKSGGASRKGVLYQPAIHPDLRDVPAAHDCIDRFSAIKKYAVRHTGNLLDVGANLCYFCHKFELLGYTCYAIEVLEDVAWAAGKIRIAEGKNFRIFSGDLFELFRNKSLKSINFQTVLALNIFHHFIKTEEKHAELRCWLENLATESMFFESHRYDDPQMRNAYVNYREEEFLEFILNNSMLNKWEFIHKCKDGRRIFLLYK